MSKQRPIHGAGPPGKPLLPLAAEMEILEKLGTELRIGADEIAAMNLSTDVLGMTLQEMMSRLTGTLTLQNATGETQTVTYLEYVLNLATYIDEGWIPVI